MGDLLAIYQDGQVQRLSSVHAGGVIGRTLLAAVWLSEPTPGERGIVECALRSTGGRQYRTELVEQVAAPAREGK